MILKTLSLSIFAAVVLFAAASPSPLNIGSRSTDTGGTKSAIDAYSDGGGVLLINQVADTKVDNSAMNNLVFKYGAAAKKNGVTLGAEVKTLSTTSTAQEKLLADKLNATNLAFTAIPDNTTCNDYDPQTIGDKFVSGFCSGISVASITGGTITTIPGFRVHTFTSSGTFVAPANLNIEYLIVAGGGGGGSGALSYNNGGGGGAGGFLTGTVSVNASSYAITVGNGGAANQSGQNSSALGIITIGGGHGGYGTGAAPASGGSGGGSSSRTNGAGAAGTVGQGFAGGLGYFVYPNVPAGGGGGAGGAGLAYTPPDGGAGKASSISGTSKFYAGGGGGAADGGSGAGGNGGGGRGVMYYEGAGLNYAQANTGGGGGGGASQGASIAGGLGGSGIVILRYTYP